MDVKAALKKLEAERVQTGQPGFDKGEKIKRLHRIYSSLLVILEMSLLTHSHKGLLTLTALLERVRLELFSWGGVDAVESALRDITFTFETPPAENDREIDA